MEVRGRLSEKTLPSEKRFTVVGSQFTVFGYQFKAGQMLWWIRRLRSLIHLTIQATNVSLSGGLSEANPPKTVNSISHRAKMAESVPL
jgi:hypothetical protein